MKFYFSLFKKKKTIPLMRPLNRRSKDHTRHYISILKGIFFPTMIKSQILITRANQTQQGSRLKISVSMDISVLAFYGYIGYIGDISVDIFL